MENENYTLARKYAGILLRSPRNYFLAKGLLKAMEGRRDTASTTDKALSPVITDSPIVNLGLLRKAGMQSAMANERLAAYMRLSVMNWQLLLRLFVHISFFQFLNKIILNKIVLNKNI